MDVVRSEVVAMGGRIETATAAGQGTSFKLILPLTTAVTQVVMLRCGESIVAVPSTLVEIVRRATPQEVEPPTRAAPTSSATSALPFFWLGALLQLGAAPRASRRPQRAPSSSSAAPSSASRCTSTKCSATRKSWSRTSGRSCRACPAWPA